MSHTSPLVPATTIPDLTPAHLGEMVHSVQAAFARLCQIAPAANPNIISDLDELYLECVAVQSVIAARSPSKETDQILRSILALKEMIKNQKVAWRAAVPEESISGRVDPYADVCVPDPALLRRLCFYRQKIQQLRDDPEACRKIMKKIMLLQKLHKKQNRLATATIARAERAKNAKRMHLVCSVAAQATLPEEASDPCLSDEVNLLLEEFVDLSPNDLTASLIHELDQMLAEFVEIQCDEEESAIPEVKVASTWGQWLGLC